MTYICSLAHPIFSPRISSASRAVSKAHGSSVLMRALKRKFHLVSRIYESGTITKKYSPDFDQRGETETREIISIHPWGWILRAEDMNLSVRGPLGISPEIALSHKDTVYSLAKIVFKSQVINWQWVQWLFVSKEIIKETYKLFIASRNLRTKRGTVLSIKPIVLFCIIVFFRVKVPALEKKQQKTQPITITHNARAHRHYCVS